MVPDSTVLSRFYLIKSTSQNGTWWQEGHHHQHQRIKQNEASAVGRWCWTSQAVCSSGHRSPGSCPSASHRAPGRGCNSLSIAGRSRPRAVTGRKHDCHRIPLTAGPTTGWGHTPCPCQAKAGLALGSVTFNFAHWVSSPALAQPWSTAWLGRLTSVDSAQEKRVLALEVICPSRVPVLEAWSLVQPY